MNHGIMFTFLLLLASFEVFSSESCVESKEISVENITGNWSHSLDGVVINYSLNEDRTFSGSATSNGLTFWEYEGTWKLKGVYLMWEYTKSNAVVSPGQKNTDKIINIGCGSYRFEGEDGQVFTINKA
jgi:hypothetical protein